MVLPRVPLLPFALLPMTVYEPRYRKMVRFALEGDRLFCVALMKPGVEQASRVSQFYQTGGIGLIRACVMRGDGAYNLVLQGLARVQMEGWCRVRPFRVAQIIPLPSGRGGSEEAMTLVVRVLELCSELKQQGTEVPGPIERQLETVSDPSALADIVSHTFVRDPFARQQLLEELSVTNRLRRLIAQLESELKV